MTFDQLVGQIKEKRSFLCVGLDPDIRKLPAHLKKSPNPILEFNKSIISATSQYCVSYKLNTAFYEAYGAEGWTALKETIKLIPPGQLIIADAKRGDIGNTAAMYAKAIFEGLQADAVTLSPYMGTDTLEPYAKYLDKWLIVLALTSNPGSTDFEEQPLENGELLFESVMKQCAMKHSKQQLMFVVGATKDAALNRIRKNAPEHFLLVPGIGSQGGNLDLVANQLMTSECGILVNASRSIIYAGHNEYFAEAAGKAAKNMQQQMDKLLCNVDLE